MAACLLGGDSGVSGNKNNALKAGTYRISDDGIYAESVMAIVNACYAAGITHAKTSPFITAIAACLRTPEFDAKTFIDKIRRRPTAIRKCSSRDDYLREIDNTYNYASKNPIALERLVRNNMLRRQKCFGDK
jgi:hypothetical protein